MLYFILILVTSELLAGIDTNEIEAKAITSMITKLNGNIPITNFIALLRKNCGLLRDSLEVVDSQNYAFHIRIYQEYLTKIIDNLDPDAK